MDKKDVFISYSSNDRSFALHLYDALSEYGVGVWMDVKDIPPGQRWDRVIQQALESCTQLVLVHTSSSFDSDNVWDEWSFFLQRNKPVIPLIAEAGISLPFRLERVHFVDFCEQGFESAVEQLVSVLPHFEPTPTPGIFNNSTGQFFQSSRPSARPSGRGSYPDDRERRTRLIRIGEPPNASPDPMDDDLLNLPQIDQSWTERMPTPFSSVTAAWMTEAEFIVESRFDHPIIPLIDLTRQRIAGGIQDNKPTPNLALRPSRIPNTLAECDIC